MPKGRRWNPVDVHVGARILRRRTMIHMRQIELAQRVGVTFQAIQKYESGANRVSASMLWAIAGALGEPVSYFYEGLPDAPVQKRALAEELVAIQIVRPLMAMSPEMRERFVELARNVAKALAER